MDTGQIVHTVVAVFSIMGAGTVALVCDVLKANNERLRQANVELRARREEERHRTELALAQLKRVQATAEKALASTGVREIAAKPKPAIAAVEIANRPARRAAPPPLTQPAAVAKAGPAVAHTPVFEHATTAGRKDWDQLIRTARLSAGSIPAPAARHRGELIPFESLQPVQGGLDLPEDSTGSRRRQRYSASVEASAAR